LEAVHIAVQLFQLGIDWLDPKFSFPQGLGEARSSFKRD
jgi:hypothetical protein